MAGLESEQQRQSFFEDVEDAHSDFVQISEIVGNLTTTQLQAAYDLTKTTSKESLVARAQTLSDESLEALLV